ncbi:MAG TPA: ribulose-phosphate 3-epimerase [Longimicrobiaceae bacterium]|nr:ribulose-phosphate 3-epimerase [Longimicrobiaceae bacterium]
MRPILVAPSILSADFRRLGEQVAEAEAAGADWIHVDVMDGHFVPNITMGPLIAAAVRGATSLPIDTHLMIEAPGRFVSAFADAGVDSLTVHVEACPHLHRTVEQIREAGLSAAVALNPATPLEAISEILPYVEMILVMTVNPGFGGQSFIPTSLGKIARLREMLAERGLERVLIEVDGGIDAETALDVVRAGATTLVAGSAIYNSSGSVLGNVAALRSAATAGEPGSGG